jgi:hypothetical protein
MSDFINSKTISVIIKINFILALIFVSIYTVNTMGLILYGKSMLRGIYWLMPWSLKNLFSGLTGLIPFIMFGFSILLIFEGISRKKILLTLGLWFFCIIELLIQVIENISHISFR